MKYLIYFLIFLFTSSVVYSQFYPYSEQNSGVTTQLNCISGDGKYYWICGNNGVVLRTYNYGTNWLNAGGNGIPSNINLTTIFGIDSTKALVSGTLSSVTYVYKTSNSGANWNLVFSQPNGFINFICFYNPNTNGILVGNPISGRWSIFKTTNGGMNWDSAGCFLPQVNNESSFSNSYSLKYNNIIWFGTNNSRIYYSTNGGNIWVIQSTTPQVNTRCIYFEGYSNEGLSGGDSLMFTTNYGSQWSIYPSIGSGSFGGIAGTWLIGGLFLPPMGKCYYVRSDNKIYFKLYGSSSSWQVRYTAPNGIYTYFARARQSFDCFGLRNNGGITHGMVEFEGKVNKISSEIPNNFILFQNYPNPFNPSTNIIYQITKNCFVQLHVYDLIGSKIAVIVNEQQTPGIYKVSLDGSNLSSGIYFYKIISGDFTDSRKMILIK